MDLLCQQMFNPPRLRGTLLRIPRSTLFMLLCLLAGTIALIMGMAQSDQMAAASRKDRLVYGFRLPLMVKRWVGATTGVVVRH